MPSGSVEQGGKEVSVHVFVCVFVCVCVLMCVCVHDFIIRVRGLTAAAT